MLIEFCKLIISDSGGIQEEAPSLNKPLVTVEGLNAVKVLMSMSFLVGTDEENICKLVKKLYRNSDFDGHVKNQPNPYGDGNAAKRIIQSLRSLMSMKRICVVGLTILDCLLQQCLLHLGSKYLATT